MWARLYLAQLHQPQELTPTGQGVAVVFREIGVLLQVAVYNTRHGALGQVEMFADVHGTIDAAHQYLDIALRRKGFGFGLVALAP